MSTALECTSQPSGISTVSIASYQNASEQNSAKGVFVIVREDDSSNSLTVPFILSGTAQRDIDFSAATNSITFEPGELEKSIEISPIDDTVLEGDEEITLTLMIGLNYILGVDFNKTITLIDNEAQLNLSTETINFAPLQVGSSASQSLYLYNLSSVPLELGELVAEDEFRIQNDHCSQQTLLDGQDCTLEIVFQPTNNGIHTGHLSIPSNAIPNLQLVDLTGVAPVSSKLTKNVSSPDSPMALSFSGGGEYCEFSAVNWIDSATSTDIPGAPAGAKYANGIDFVDFQIDDCNPGSTIDVTLEFNQAIPENAKLMKFGPTPDNLNPHWSELESAIFSETQVSYSITDGESGDFDLALNGSIIDPVGILIPEQIDVAAPVPPSVTNTTQPIPSLQPVMLITLMLALLGMSANHSYIPRQRRPK